MIRNAPKTTTTEMEVTSIRLERELKESLKELSGHQGYQALIRDILWNYVHHRTVDSSPTITIQEIRASINATSQREEKCALTGKSIPPYQPMLLGLTSRGDMLPLSPDSL